ncbi:MAG: class I tRNA ligase family protein, partial [Thermoplasmata archaeon]
MEREREAHWQEAWRSAGLARGERDPSRQKFYAIVAYSGTSGFVHLGHFRGLVYADALHRYHRMRGARVFFPQGVHASGLPAVTFAQKVKDRHPATIRELELQGVDPSVWPRLEDPETAARFLGETYLRAYRSMGLLVDEDAYLTTIDADYRAFIRWQFHRLKHAGALTQKSHFAPVCPTCGPVAVDPSETDLSAGGDAEVVRFHAIAFRLDDGRILLAATLRPETIYGVTNLWIPAAEPLSVWHHEGRTYLVSRSGAERLAEQHGGRVGHAVPPGELEGKSVVVPLTGVRVPVHASPLVDPRIGTGVVMSVPAHSPADALGVAALPPRVRETLRAPPIVLAVPPAHELPPSEQALVAGTGTPAERANRHVGAKSLDQTEAVAEATERLYRLEHARGTMTVPDLLGVPVPEARERVIASLGAAGSLLDLQEFDRPVLCRNGHAVVIRRIPHQWFLRYGDPAWKALGRQALDRLRVSPDDYARELPEILEWIDDRPCTRRGRWLGTPFPFDPEWVIEPIADSTIYPAYYPVRRVVRARGIPPESLTDAFFDYVFLGQGEGEPGVDRAVLDEARDEFRYWYPLDLNIGGKEHKRVHFPPFVLTHARLFPPEAWPRGILCHGWVVGTTGEKLSKKDVGAKGGAIPTLREALERWGADALRLVYVSAATPALDMEWDPALADTATDRLSEIERLARGTRGDGAGVPELDAWLMSEMHGIVRRATEAFAEARLRDAAEAIYVAVPALLRRYSARGGVAGDATDRLGRAWIRLLSPITPHLAEELGTGRFEGLVAAAPFPSPDEFPRSEAAEAAERYLAQVEEDLRHVLRPLQERGEAPPSTLVLFVAEPWKREVEQWMRESLDQGRDPTIPSILERAQRHPETAAHRAEIAKYVQRVAPLLRSEPPLGPARINEVAVLKDAQAYLARRFGFADLDVPE